MITQFVTKVGFLWRVTMSVTMYFKILWKFVEELCVFFVLLECGYICHINWKTFCNDDAIIMLAV